MGEALVATKLLPPWAHRRTVARPQLVGRLRAGLSGPLTLLCAPAGFGKTSLALQALDGHPAAVAWLSLEPDDGEPTRFAHYLLAALTKAVPALAPTLDPLLRSRPLDLPATMAALVNLLSTRDVPLVLVLEDYHAVDSPPVDQALGWLVVHAPVALRLLMTSREDPQLPLGRLRARGQLTELRGADLRFSAGEAAALITDVTGLALTGRQTDDLVVRTEGWAVGLQLAGLALREAPDVDGLIASLRGTHRLVFDYLVDEVLLGQPSALQQFLLRTSVLDRLCGDLCDAVLGIGSSQAVLLRLERANLFLVPLDADRRWYRYHALLADMLRARLASTQEVSVAVLHRRAAAWFASAVATHGTAMLDSAIQHALEGGDHELAADLIERGMLIPTTTSTTDRGRGPTADDVGPSNPHLLGRGDLALTARWLARLPPEFLVRRPLLGTMRAWLLTLTGRYREALTCLGDAERAWAVPSQVVPKPEDAALVGGNMAAIRAYLSFMGHDLEAAIAHGQAALRQIPPTDTSARAASQLILGRGFLERDQLAQAEQHLRRATAHGLAGDNPYAALVAQGWLAELLRRQGRLVAAEELLAAALEAQRDPGGAPFPIAGDLCVRLGLLHYERDDREGAARLLEQGRRCGELMSNGWMVEPAYLALAWLRQVDGDPAGAHRLLDALEVLAPRMERMVDPDQVHALRARLWLAQGDHAAVGAWLEREQAQPVRPYRPAQLEVALTRARALVCLDRCAEAVAVLEPLLSAAEAAGRAGQQIQLEVLRAVALQAAGERERAVAALRPALEQGAARGYLRTFLDEGPAVATLLRAMQTTQTTQTTQGRTGARSRYVGRLLAAFAASDGTTRRQAAGQAPRADGAFAAPGPFVLHESLTARELELLRLIDAGLSNQAIADRLVLSVGTVKFYLNTLYRKLAVHGRTEALARARALGLLA